MPTASRYRSRGRGPCSFADPAAGALGSSPRGRGPDLGLARRDRRRELRRAADRSRRARRAVLPAGRVHLSVPRARLRGTRPADDPRRRRAFPLAARAARDRADLARDEGSAHGMALDTGIPRLRDVARRSACVLDRSSCRARARICARRRGARGCDSRCGLRILDAYGRARVSARTRRTLRGDLRDRESHATGASRIPHALCTCRVRANRIRGDSLRGGIRRARRRSRTLVPDGPSTLAVASRARCTARGRARDLR